MRPRQVKLDKASGTVSYVLLKPARVRIRLGLKDNGPFLRTLVDWAPRPAGLQREQWDGFDTGRVLNFNNNPNVDVAVEAFALSSNAIIVAGAAETGGGRFVQAMNTGKNRRVKKAPLSTIKMSPHAAHPIETNRDPKINLVLPTPNQQTGSQDSVIVIDRPAAIEMQLAQGEPELQSDGQFEIAYYLDFKFFEEVYVDQLPATWTLDPTKVAGGYFPVSNFVGDGVVSPRCYVDLNNVFDALTFENKPFYGGEWLVLSRMMGISGYEMDLYEIPVNEQLAEMKPPQDTLRCPCDVDNDGDVDGSDFAAFSADAARETVPGIWVVMVLSMGPIW